MNGMSRFLEDADLLLLIETLMPEHRDKERMVRTLREDPDIFGGMLADQRLFARLMENRETLTKVSPFLFFTVLLSRVKVELKQRSYTIEQESRHRMVVFDSGEVVNLLEQEDILAYIADMLVSFVKINSFSVMTRARKGVWRKFRFSDFDIDSLIRYSTMIEEEQRFGPYKRIADICLFVLGVFPDFVEANRLHRRRTAGAPMGKEEFVSRGKHYYRAAALHSGARLLRLHGVLLKLSEDFSLAVKPLTYLSTAHLGFLKERLFLK